MMTKFEWQEGAGGTKTSEKTPTNQSPNDTYGLVNIYLLPIGCLVFLAKIQLYLKETTALGDILSKSAKNQVNFLSRIVRTFLIFFFN